MDVGNFAARLEAMPGAACLDHLGRFDADNEAHVDEAARYLLERFRQHNDLDAFTLLFELTHARLATTADRIVRKLAPAVQPDDLASAFMARLFADVRQRVTEPVRHFLALAHTSMRNDLLDQLRQHKRAAANGRTYHSTLRLPEDPAEALQAREQEHLFLGFGRAVLRLTAECFQELEPRDQQVLVAREIVRLPYDRVASMLNLSTEQVGMIIRRARMHLVQRLVARMPEAASAADIPFDASQLQSLRETVVANLGSKESTRHVQALMQRMLDLSAEAGRRKLADLIYEMAKACLVVAPGFTSRTLIAAVPRRSDQVGGDLRQMAHRLAGVVGAPDVDAVALTRPEPGTALQDAHACLEKLAEIEGTSGRQQVALGLAHIHGGKPGQAEAILRPLLEQPLAARTRQNASRNLTLALLRQDRHADALAAAEAAGKEWPDDPVRVMNLCYASARLGDATRFARYAGDLGTLQLRNPSERVGAWLADELAALAAEVGFTHLLPAPRAGSPTDAEADAPALPRASHAAVRLTSASSAAVLPDPGHGDS
ncbi:MAG TPA: sigma-70 family RNA polymerase sigma factor [Planctomycetota bacterium]|nr:sigma-70 family RNA polymerase sigma factor [Planctomycetota bacterium]